MADPFPIGADTRYGTVSNWPLAAQYDCMAIGIRPTPTPEVVECFMQIDLWESHFLFRVPLPVSELPLLHYGKRMRLTFKGIKGAYDQRRLDQVQLTPGGRFYPIFS